MIIIFTQLLLFSTAFSGQPLQTIQAETMTLSGPYAGLLNNVFNGIGLYGNGDTATAGYTFPTAPGQYSIAANGRSTTGSTAYVSLYIAGTKAGEFSFNNSVSLSTVTFNVDSTMQAEIKLTVEKDNGSWDAEVDYLQLYYEGQPVPLPAAPNPPSTGAYYTGVYRNLFKERGFTDAEISAKIDYAWSKLFYGNDNEKIYYTAGTDMAYILDSGNNDVRSEGMSYGMMICAQTNHKQEFDALWKWAKTNMQNTSGDYKDYFAWQCRTDGSKMDPAPAPDGDEWIAMALLFASGRWGDGVSPFDYKNQANAILTACLHQADDGQGNPLWDLTSKLIKFSPVGSAQSYTDPSYHLPHYLKLFSILGSQDNVFWNDAAAASRSYLHTAANATTGLMPDYANFDGSPNNNGGHDAFRFDAWRCAMNMAMDYSWFADDAWQKSEIDKLQAFFASEGISSYGNQYSISGSRLSPDHSPGLVAMNAAAGLAATTQNAWRFIDDYWNTQMTTGQYRYYDGLLYMMSLLGCSGNFRIYGAQPVNRTATQVSLSANPGALYADGSSQSTITAQISDSNGYVVQLSSPVTFSLNGPGSMEQPYTKTSTNGIATIIYTAGTTAGTAAITAVSPGLTQGSFNITLTTPPQPQVTVLSPNGGESWQTGTTQAVTWTSLNLTGNVDIEMSYDGTNGPWITLKSATANDGIEAVTLPATPTLTGRIRVKSVSGAPYDYSDNNFTLTTVPQPVLSLSASLIDFGSIELGQSGTSTFNITNSGEGMLTGAITGDRSWVTVTPSSFVIPAQAGIQSVTVTLNTTSLAAGANTGTVTVTSNGGTASVNITVNVTIPPGQNPYIALSTTSLNFGELDLGKLSETKAFTIKNDGQGTLTGTISVSDSWIEASPKQFQITNSPFQINVTVDNSVLAQKEGPAKGEITITSNGNNGAQVTTTITVEFTATCVLVKPNPFRLSSPLAGEGKGEGCITFFGDGIVPGQTTIIIYTLSGTVVADLSAPDNVTAPMNGQLQNEITWQPSNLSPGIYIYVYESPKEKGAGKFTVTR